MKRLLLLAILALVPLAAPAVTPAPPQCLTAIAPGQTINGALTPSSCYFFFTSAPADVFYMDVYYFDGIKGQQVAITMNSTALDPWLDLYDVNDLEVGPIISDDDGGGGANARIPPESGFFPLPATGRYYISANTYYAGQTGAYTLTFTSTGGPPTPAVGTVTEFYNPALDHYFITANTAEAANLSAGNLPPWAPTGKTFPAWLSPGTNITQVWRFFSASFAPKSSHFYTNNPAEAQSLVAGGVWTLEQPDAFFVMPSPSGTCPGGTQPVYRLYNNGQGGAPNHRYTTDPGVRAQMIAAQWVPEGSGANGVFGCVPT